MLRSIRKRLLCVEESSPPQMNASRFYARAQQHAKRKGGSVEDAISVLAKDLSGSDLDSIAAEFERIVFGDDTAARDSAKRKVFAAAGYPDWTNRTPCEASN